MCSGQKPMTVEMGGGLIPPNLSSIKSKGEIEMFGKSNIKLRMGLAVLVLCTALFMTAMPAAANYTADNPLTTYASGSITGDMNYTIGNSSYSSKMWSNDTNNLYTVSITETIPNNEDVVLGRLYVYWTWSYNATGGVNEGVNAVMNVTFDGNLLTLDDSYTDRKDSGTYNYPSGTYAYNVTGYIKNTGANTYVVKVNNTYDPSVNQSFNVQGVGLLTLYNEFEGDVKYYWIAEGNDLTYVKYDNTTTYSWKNDITPDDATVLANFTGVNTTDVISADLTTVVPSGGTAYNRLYFNYFFNYPAWGIRYWDGLWNAAPYSDLSWTTTDVKDNLKDGTNYVGFQNGLYTMLPDNSEGQMQAANAFLLVKKS